jgi:hypothetical protein
MINFDALKSGKVLAFQRFNTITVEQGKIGQRG